MLNNELHELTSSPFCWDSYSSFEILPRVNLFLLYATSAIDYSSIHATLPPDQVQRSWGESRSARLLTSLWPFILNADQLQHSWHTSGSSRFCLACRERLDEKHRLWPAGCQMSGFGASFVWITPDMRTLFLNIFFCIFKSTGFILYMNLKPYLQQK